jgi:uncharacterized protein (TIGR02453 family)
MFEGFTDETLRMFMDIRFHNYTSYFHEQHDRYIETVQKPFYALIEDLSDAMTDIDPQMEIRPYKCLAHIHRDTRFSKDKSPYRDHLWFLFRRAGEPREKSLNYFFEFGPDRLNWGMGFWGENREALDIFRKKMTANPDGILSMIDHLEMDRHKLYLDAGYHKRMTVPDGIPERLKNWYLIKYFYICRIQPGFDICFSEKLRDVVKGDFKALAPLYRLLRGCCDEL